MRTRNSVWGAAYDSYQIVFYIMTFSIDHSSFVCHWLFFALRHFLSLRLNLCAAIRLLLLLLSVRKAHVRLQLELMILSIDARLLDCVNVKQLNTTVARRILRLIADTLDSHLEIFVLATILPAWVDHRRWEQDCARFAFLLACVFLQQGLTVATPQANCAVGTKAILQITFVCVEREDALTIGKVASVRLGGGFLLRWGFRARRVARSLQIENV